MSITFFINIVVEFYFQCSNMISVIGKMHFYIQVYSFLSIQFR